MATATQYVIIGGVIIASIIGTVALVGDRLNATFGSALEQTDDQLAAMQAPIEDPYGGPTFATAREGLDSGRCPLGVTPLESSRFLNRWMCANEDTPRDNIVTAVAEPYVTP